MSVMARKRSRARRTVRPSLLRCIASAPSSSTSSAISCESTVNSGVLPRRQRGTREDERKAGALSVLVSDVDVAALAEQVPEDRPVAP